MTLASHRCAFLSLDSVNPVTHAVANTIKRVAVIVVSVLYFHKPLTPTGASGSTIAIIGVLLYSLAKAEEPPPPEPTPEPTPAPLVATRPPIVVAARAAGRSRAAKKLKRS